MKKVVAEFQASGLNQAVVNRTNKYDIEPTQAWRGLQPYLDRYGHPLEVEVVGADVILKRKVAR